MIFIFFRDTPLVTVFCGSVAEEVLLNFRLNHLMKQDGET